VITESFLESCFSMILSESSKIKKTKVLYRDILEIITFYEKSKEISIPINIQQKTDLLKKITELLSSDKSLNESIDSILYSEKYKQFSEYIDNKRKEKLNSGEWDSIINQIRLRKKINALFKNFDYLNNVIETIKDGTFDSLDDAVLDYENMVRILFSNMMDNNRSISLEAASSLDLKKDDFDDVLSMIIKKYERKNVTPTGFPLFDREVFNGGFEPSRLYLFAGGSGSGKSTLLLNLITNSSTNNYLKLVNKDEKPRDIPNVYVYITMENTIEESLLRLYMQLFNKTILDSLEDIKNHIDIKKEILRYLNITNSTIIMKYFPPMSISASDIMVVLDDAINEYGKDSIKGLYVDYLDLLKLDVKYDIYRLELGHITLSLKTIAVHYNIPVITASQLGRASYRISKASELNIDQIGESIKKVEHADFVCLMARNLFNQDIVHGKVGKNRGGKSNVDIQFKVDFQIYKFISASKESVMKDGNISESAKFNTIKSGF